MTKNLSYMPMYWRDYADDTDHLTTLQHGAYLLLISRYWRTGKPLQNSPEWLRQTAKMNPEEWAENSMTVLAFFQPDGAVLKHKRVDMELEKARAKAAKNTANIKKRWGSSKVIDFKRN